MSEGQKFQLGTIGALSLSVVSSVSIVICNKALISTLGFTFGKHLITRVAGEIIFLWIYSCACVVKLTLSDRLEIIFFHTIFGIVR